MKLENESRERKERDEAEQQAQAAQQETEAVGHKRLVEVMKRCATKTSEARGLQCQ